MTQLAAMIIAMLGAGEPALAGLGQPSPWQLGLQESASPVMTDIIWFHDFLLYIITAIAAFVLALLIVVMVRFNARANPIPWRTTHNTLVEIAWTIIPIMILMFIAVPSFKLLFLQLNIPAADLTATKEGIYYGQCSELCGKDHAFMPIAVRVVSEQAFSAWIEDAKKKYARNEALPSAAVASAQRLPQ
jgi:heme/copper-type cytochrome/quinol oxidase subunit 2